MRGYSTREVAEVLDVPLSRIRSWARSGLLTPDRDTRGAYLFSFQDVVLLRAARELLHADVPARRVRAALEALREQLPAGRPLSAVHIAALGDRVLVRDAETVWEPDSGQLRLDFAVAEVAERAGPVARRAFEAATEDPGMSADDWFDAGLDLEPVAPDRARAAYRKALDLDAAHAEAHVNLGRLLHEAGNLDAAEGHYRAAVASDPGSARARYNLGVVLEDRGRLDEALTAYQAAIDVDERLAAAHFNLARLWEARGDDSKAFHHLATYRGLLEPEERA